MFLQPVFFVQIVALVSFIKIQEKICSLSILYLAISEGKIDNLDVNQLSRNHAQEEKDHHKDDPNLSNCSVQSLGQKSLKQYL